MLYVKPVDGCLVLDPDSNHDPLPALGKHVPDNLYWQRRLLFGEVITAEAPAPLPIKNNKKGGAE